MGLINCTRVRALTSVIVITSMFALSSCSRIDERVYPATNQADFDHYYGVPSVISGAKGTHGMTKSHAMNRIKVRTQAPKTYVVKKGDTLWSISRMFLQKPWYWPEIWDKNQKIKNPHLIYPGDTLHLYYTKNSQNGKLEPRIRVVRTGTGKPVSTLIPFLAWPRVMDKNTIKNAPYIVASRDDHYLIGEGETVYIKRLTGAMKGSRYAVYHPNRKLEDPETGRILGYEVDYVAYSRIEQPGELAKATILDIDREVRKGDRLFSPRNEDGHLNIPIRNPEKRVRGSIISLYDAEAITGQFMVATMNKGRNDGMKVGYTLGIYAPGKAVVDEQEKRRAELVKHHSHIQQVSHAFSNAINPQTPPGFDINVQLPPERVATMVLYQVTDEVSYGLIIESEREVKKGYKIGNP